MLSTVMILAAIACWRRVLIDDAAGSASRSEQVRSTIDPNAAPWWELMVLPRVGAVTAKRIVAYRQAARQAPADPAPRAVYRSASDLEQVHGIGPKTVRRIAPYLVFDEVHQPAR